MVQMAVRLTQRLHLRRVRSLISTCRLYPPLAFPSQKEDCDLPSLYWIPKLHKSPYKQRFIAGSAKCSTKPLSVLLTSILTEVKDGLQKYCETKFF